MGTGHKCGVKFTEAILPNSATCLALSSPCVLSTNSFTFAPLGDGHGWYLKDPTRAYPATCRSPVLVTYPSFSVRYLPDISQYTLRPVWALQFPLMPLWTSHTVLPTCHISYLYWLRIPELSPLPLAFLPNCRALESSHRDNKNSPDASASQQGCLCNIPLWLNSICLA